MKEESEERKEQSKERTRKDKKKERVRVEDTCQRKEEEKSRKAEKGAWMVMGDGKGNSREGEVGDLGCQVMRGEAGRGKGKKKGKEERAN